MLVKFIFAFFSGILLILFWSKKEMALKLMLLMKENDILKRRFGLQKKRIGFSSLDKCIFSFFSAISSHLSSFFSLVRPETVLKWYHNLIKKHWTFQQKKKSVGEGLKYRLM